MSPLIFFQTLAANQRNGRTLIYQNSQESVNEAFRKLETICDWSKFLLPPSLSAAVLARAAQVKGLIPISNSARHCILACKNQSKPRVTKRKMSAEDEPGTADGAANAGDQVAESTPPAEAHGAPGDSEMSQTQQYGDGTEQAAAAVVEVSLAEEVDETGDDATKEEPDEWVVDTVGAAAASADTKDDADNAKTKSEEDEDKKGKLVPKAPLEPPPGYAKAKGEGKGSTSAAGGHCRHFYTNQGCWLGKKLPGYPRQLKASCQGIGSR